MPINLVKCFWGFSLFSTPLFSKGWDSKKWLEEKKEGKKEKDS